MAKRKTKDDVLYLSFNQDHSCISCGKQDGFVIFNVNPIQVRYDYKFDGGIGIVEILDKTNLLALVGGGDHPQFPPNKVIIWDDIQKKGVHEIEKHCPVRGLKFNKNVLVVAYDKSIEVYRFTDIYRLRKIEIIPNRGSVFALSSNLEHPLVLTQDTTSGSVKVCNYEKAPDTDRTVRCHQSELCSITINQDGTKFATASKRGTLLRIYDMETLNLIKELRRGSDQADIYSINFSRDSKYFVATSKKGTIHVYSMCDQFQNTKSSFSFLGSVLPKIVSDEWSLFKIPYKVDGPHLCCIISCEGQSLNKLLVIDYKGNFSYYKFDLKNMSYQKTEEGSILEIEDCFSSKNVTEKKCENDADNHSSSLSTTEESEEFVKKPKVV